MFVSKLADADGEVAETQNWLDFSLSCGYISSEVHNSLYSKYESVGGMLGNMMQMPEKFAPRGRTGIN